MMSTIQIKRIYEAVGKNDGMRILIDRLWPRGVKKEVAHIDQWLKDIAPSTDLRKWFNHDPHKWEEFQAKYLLELNHNDRVKELLDMIKESECVTLIYAAHDEQHNHALVLMEFLANTAKA